MFETRQVRRLAEEKQALALQCASDRVRLATEAEAFRDANRWVNLVADGVTLVGPKLPSLISGLLGLFAIKSAKLAPPKLVRFGKIALVVWKLGRAGLTLVKRLGRRQPVTLVR